jgi:NADH-quinone oxidoreductase subunit N
MTDLQFTALLPYTLLAGASIVVILLIALRASHTVIQILGFLLMCSVAIAMIVVREMLPVSISPLLQIDRFAFLFTGLIIFCVFIVGLFSYIYFEEREENPKEYYILLFLSTLGACTLTISSHFISFFIGLELLSVSLYSLIAYLRTRNNAVEAGVKYLVLAAISSAFLLFGMALVYMDTGSLEFTAIGSKLGSPPSSLFITGIGMMIVAIGFKLALAPFHFWAADVYQGAPSPVTTFIATVSKVGVFAVLLRFAESTDMQSNKVAIYILAGISIISMITGNLLALQQKNLKRLLAYSSIAHFGYLLVAFLPGNDAGTQAATFYLLAYSITILAAFGIVTLLSNRERDADQPAFYRGLFWRSPFMASILTLAMLSLAGIPLTGGFIGKFMVLMTGVQQQLWIPVIVLVLTSVLGLYYYLRVIVLMFDEGKVAGEKEKILHPFFYFATYFALFILSVLLLWVGIFPAAWMDGIRDFL